MFNSSSHTENSYKTSMISTASHLVGIIMSFVYRTVFLYFLGKEYLGINGLFSNILQFFSLVELGMTTIISYRLYKPIAENDVRKVAAFLNFYRKIYLFIGLFVIFAGACFMPFISAFVNLNEIPSDINPYFVFFLFTLQSASSYFFAYKQVLISADQRGYISYSFYAVVNIISNIAKIAVLAITRKFTLILIVGIAVQLLSNMIYSFYITKKYREVFKIKAKITPAERSSIFKDTRAGLCHRIGATVVTSTDNIILTKFVSLAVTGIYSNYSLLTSSVLGVCTALFNGLSPSIGDYCVTASEDESEDLYLKIFFINLWISSFCTICLFMLANPFIYLWQDSSFLLDNGVVFVLIIQFFMQSTNLANGVFINATGLFNRDKFRPLIESALNLTISIIFVKLFGVIGVFIGTIASGLLTYYWRNYYLLYKNVFKRGPVRIIAMISLWIAVSVGISALLSWLFSFVPEGWLGFAAKVIMCAVIPNIIFLLVFHQSKYFEYYKSKVVLLLSKLRRNPKA